MASIACQSSVGPLTWESTGTWITSSSSILVSFVFRWFCLHSSCCGIEGLSTRRPCAQGFGSFSSGCASEPSWGRMVASSSAAPRSRRRSRRGIERSCARSMIAVTFLSKGPGVESLAFHCPGGSCKSSAAARRGAPTSAGHSEAHWSGSAWEPRRLAVAAAAGRMMEFWRVAFPPALLVPCRSAYHSRIVAWSYGKYRSRSTLPWWSSPGSRGAKASTSHGSSCWERPLYGRWSPRCNSVADCHLEDHWYWSHWCDSQWWPHQPNLIFGRISQYDRLIYLAPFDLFATAATQPFASWSDLAVWELILPTDGWRSRSTH